MITNERQYQITKKKAERFDKALAEFNAKEREGADVSTRLIRAEQSAMEAQLSALRKEIEDYERVKNEGVYGQVIASIDNLSELLINARIALKMTHRELAEQLHVKEQQIQRYEADRYASASYRRLCEVAHALGVGSQIRFYVQPRESSSGLGEQSDTQDSALVLNDRKP